MVDLTPLINAVIAILAAIITPKIVAWFNVRLDAEERKELLAWVKIGVAALALSPAPGQCEVLPRGGRAAVAQR